MNLAFEKALAARSLWINVAVLSSIEGCEPQAEEALQSAYDAVHQLASDDVLIHRHYGPRAPLLLLDVPELAEQYNLAHELYTELYYENYRNGSIGQLSAGWLNPASPLDLPYTKWLVAVDMQVAALMETSCSQVAEATQGQAKTLLLAWSWGIDADEAAEAVVLAHIEREYEREVAEEDERQAHREDIQDTYAYIEADLWAGWREECAELGLID
ncbi:hypothetical protein P4126_33395 [Pseudomonas aeruginosa]|uniref:hypothetical protein n=1 Tax=Pseudomonas aeruginosa TaxID=287 RepID=UPI000FC40984|nr:hypothetical protein [Pseudomonas aeruginosa]EKT9493351.1 hypothetical protein [Pseudomonas aeruginosa]EKU2925347.1 hypothetical protein [Pseudomonas aeruginosa]MCU9196831.1 hypothetical protein [Pseudomonas aeruginosa]MCU9228849.1 hypothetical protein [Pseudomonas aeruginosa]MDF5937393.1 hypothetical protein [Pseudomonas aeruginosa]